MSIAHEAEFSCPYCMTMNSIEIDPTNDIGQQQIVDCQICCQPIEVRVEETPGGDFSVYATTDDD
ncbi:CPXCG motif-containing cysteine-rich protein [Aliidiomarina sp. Khilg15.8]